MKHLAPLLVLLLAAPAVAAPLSSLRPADLVGCFAASTDGDKMACANRERGETFVEVKGTKNRRVYKTWPIAGGAEAGDATGATGERLRGIVRWLDKNGFTTLERAHRTPNGLQLPGLECGLEVDEAATTIVTRPVAGGDARPWLLISTHGGGSRLEALSADPAHDRAILVVDHTTAAKDATIREFKILPLSDLASRKECKPAAVPPEAGQARPAEIRE
jgi:hypothetical protein